MKHLLTLLCVCVLSTGCTALTALQAGGTGELGSSAQSRRLRAGETMQPPAANYPSVVVTPDGGHAVVMPPCGNTAVVVNPDGSHSIAVVNGPITTIITP